MSGQGGEAWDLLRPAPDDLHRSGQEVVKLPHVLSVVPRRTPRVLLKLQVEEGEEEGQLQLCSIIRSSPLLTLE